MATAQQIDGDVVIRGSLTVTGTQTQPVGLTNSNIASGAAISATKLEHQYSQTYAQANVTAVAETKAVHVTYGTTGVILKFKAGSIAACAGDSTVTVDLKKNGTTVLTSPITLNSSSVARVAQSASPSVTALAVGDLLEVVVAISAGTGTLATGVFASVELTETAA